MSLPTDRHPVADDFDVTGAEFSAYIREMAPSIQCPACGSTEKPTIAADSAEGLTHLMAYPMITPMKGVAHAVCLAFCQQCGYGWQFWANSVVNWTIEQRRKASEDE